MTGTAKTKGKYAGTAVSLLAAASLAFSPVLFPAFATNLTSGKITAASLLDSFTPAGVDSKLAAKFRLDNGNGNAVQPSKSRFAFTPAGIAREGNRTMTIAARTDSPLSSNALTVRNALRGSELGTRAPLSLAKSDFRLTSARGWKGFSAPIEKKLAVRAPVANLGVAAGNFRLDKKPAGKKSRFKADMRVDKDRSVAPSPSGNAAAGEYKVDLEGSFSVSKRVAVTAGVRYKSERDRVAPTIDERTDSEAVYVGTKIRF